MEWLIYILFLIIVAAIIDVGNKAWKEAKRREGGIIDETTEWDEWVAARYPPAPEFPRPKLPRIHQQGKLCPYCNAMNKSDEVRCSQCGGNLFDIIPEEDHA